MIRQLLILGLIVIPASIPQGALAGAPPLAMKKARAVGQASSMICLVNAGKISEEDSLDLMLNNLKKAGIYSVLPWMKTAEGTEAIQVAYQYVRSDCKGFTDADAMVKAIMPYVL
ncbi:hypothetical protein OAE23_01510 [Synechococcus sp. AH-551-E11]|nr:hypothetical protein [Synechococcus sp. AH-551-E11]MDB4616760.1 hypothetical protein [Synechococcus sp. AH-551-E11]